MHQQERAFANRLRKTAPARMRWARRQGLTAFRLYDSDIPEFRYVIDWYAGHAHVVELARRGFVPAARVEAQRAAVAAGVEEVLGVPPARIHLKTKAPKPWGERQYEKLGEGGETVAVEEDGLTFGVNLTDYIDTGLFLDHRLTRRRIREEAAGKRLLNLFCYTGSFTVHAAAGGAASTTSVDLSRTYLDWTGENLARNRLESPRHERIRADATRWLQQASGGTYDLIVLDPPSFSASKRMDGTLEIQRDHVQLIGDSLRHLAPGGALYFSTNFRGFHLDEGALPGLHLEELTPRSIPEDIRDRSIHRCWRITRA